MAHTHLKPKYRSPTAQSKKGVPFALLIHPTTNSDDNQPPDRRNTETMAPKEVTKTGLAVGQNKGHVRCLS